jgi:hypothetical protein
VSEKKNGKYLDELRKMGLVTFIEHLETPKREAETNCGGPVNAFFRVQAIGNLQMYRQLAGNNHAF